jgi:predicted kinase
MLIVFSGLPGSGKTSLAQALSRQLEADHVRIDSIEEALLKMGGEALVAQGAGYCVAYAVAEDNLKLGRTPPRTAPYQARRAEIVNPY